MKKIILLILIALMVPSQSWAALAATTVWEIQPAATAGNVNGGGYNPSNASPGTDRSQTAVAFDSGTDLATADGDVDGCVITSATHDFVADDHGNIIHITAGTGWTAGWYEIVSTSGNAATLDRACGTDGAKTGGTWYLGGALSMGSSDDAIFELAGAVWYIKYDASNPTITQSGNVAISQSGTATLPKYIIGYNSTRTIANTDADSNLALRETIDVGTSSFAVSGSNYTIRNLIFTGTGSAGVFTPGIAGTAYNVKASNTSGTADRVSLALAAGGAVCVRCEAVSTNGTAVAMGASTKFIGGYVHDSKKGIVAEASTVIAGSIIETCSSEAISAAATRDYIMIYGNTLYGTNSGDTGIIAPDNEKMVLMNNTLSNFATAVNFTTATANGFYDWNNYDTDTTTNLTQGPHDINVSPSFTDAAGANFSVTGTELDDKGFPGVIPGSATTSKRYIGAWQKNAASSGGGGAWGY